MATKLSADQIAEIEQAFKAVTDQNSLLDLHNIVRTLREGCTSAFSAEDIDSVASAIAILEKPLDSKPKWTASNGRGLFVVFEGLDRSGKSTQSKKLAKHFEDKGQVKWMCFPNRETPVGILIDLYLRQHIDIPDESIHKLFSANRWETAVNIVEELNRGVSIVCDRYAFSGVAYSAAKGLDFNWCQSTDVGLPVPDAIFYLHIDEKVGASRANFGDERYENVDMQSRVRTEFKRGALRANVNWNDVDGARDIEVIHTEIRMAVEYVQETGKENGTPPIKPLWIM